MDFAHSQESCVPAAFSHLLFAIDSTPDSFKSAVIDRAVDAIERLLVDIGSSAKGSHTSTGLPDASEVSCASLREEIEQRDESERIAVHSCIASACALLRITHLLMNRPDEDGSLQEFQDWKRLSELTKEAGREAYRAALLMVDPPKKSQRVEHGK